MHSKMEYRAISLLLAVIGLATFGYLLILCAAFFSAILFFVTIGVFGLIVIGLPVILFFSAHQFLDKKRKAPNGVNEIIDPK